MKLINTTLLLFLFSLNLCFAQQQGTGLLFDEAGYESIPKKANNVSFFDDLADIRSASLKQYVPTVKNQGGYSTCLGWSSAYYGRTILEARQQNITNTAEIDELAFSPIFTYLIAKVEDDNYNCNKGAFIHKGAQSLVDDGAPYFKEYAEAELCDDAIPDNVTQTASHNKIKDFRRLITFDAPSHEIIDNVKRALHNGNPVIGGFKVENALFVAKNVYVPDNIPTNSGHAMCVIGFDDEKYGGAFEIVNSWGTNWGNNGYIWMKYDDFVNLCQYAVELIPNPKPVDQFKTLAGELRIELKGGMPMAVAKGDGTFKKSVLGWQDVVEEEETDTKTIGDYKTVTAYPKETRYRMYAKVDQPAYVYVFGADSSGENGVLFPFEENISTYIDHEGSELVVPGEKYFFRLNKDVESDYTIVIFSLEKIDYNEVLQKLNTLEGELTDKLYVIFNDKLIPKETMTLSGNQMKFDSKFTEGSVAMLVLDIKRS
ncbi:cysteine protease [Aequorivita sublithincola DSM 14238]|uniref:Cysteine protease n=1 Tax=Aequorivita sublithincola (strain DSM 14238 / LMG 21431 / ACAM 643 / 9-3) TaxID=746697 RepID=I3YSC1_AEQSU|nr:C1 family peptidase [Aequorivita sublithincola]AFL79889.1 cysteine protease [Aequorivita sublithincola DSM 14238]